MIFLLKKVNKHVMYLAVGVAVAFSILKDLLSVAVATSYSAGMSFGGLLFPVMLFSILIFAVFARVLVYVSFRISGAIFTKKSGMLYPFPILFRDFESTALAFALPCFLLSGVLVLPSIFFPTISSVLGALRTVTTWTFLALGAAFFVKHNGHDYDRKSLAFSLSIVPFSLIVFSLVLVIAEVVR